MRVAINTLASLGSKSAIVTRLRRCIWTLALIVSSLALDSGAQTNPSPSGGFPRVSIIQVTSPNAEGEVTVSGQAGAVPGMSLVGLTTLDTGHFTIALADADGSFTARLFAPAGGTIEIKADTSNLLKPFLTVQPSYIGGVPALAQVRGTFIRVADPARQGVAVPFTAAGPTNGFPVPLPIWVISGTMERQSFQPGETLRVDATLKIVSSALDQAARIGLVATLSLERLSQLDGTGTWGDSQFASTLLTPTGLPIERWNLVREDGFAATTRQMLSRPAPDRAEASLQLALSLPADLPSGYYRPFIVVRFEDQNGRIGGVPPDPTFRSLMVLVDKGQVASLPLIRVGNPEPPRLPWLLLADTTSNGSRGVRAIEDRMRFGFSSRIMTQSETFVIPRLNRSGQAISYRLEPFAPGVVAWDGGTPPVPRIPFCFPSGSLTVRIQKPDGSLAVLGPAVFAQAHSATPVEGGNGPNASDVYQLTTLDSRFEVQFNQDGRHVITMEGSIEDIWGNTWRGGGTYEVYVGQVLALDTAVMPGTPFEVGDAFNPGLVVTPPVPAQVELRFRLAANSDPSRIVERVVQGQANRFGYFHPAESGIALDETGEYRVDVTATYQDPQGKLWMGSRTWGGVVAARNAPLIAHGRRGIRNGSAAQQWFLASEIVRRPGDPADEVFFPFQSGDVMWMAKKHSTFMEITFQDPTGQIVELMRPRASPVVEPFQARATAGETPLFSSRPDRTDPHIDPSKTDLWGYSYVSVERPLVRVREEVSEDQTIGRHYWRFEGNYMGQIGVGQDGDLPNDIKFQYGAAVLQGRALSRPQYAIYGSTFVLVRDDDPRGSRVFPPFQGNGGGPSGGPIMTLKGRDIDAFVHLTGVRPGTVLEVGDTFSLAGAVAPPLPGLVSATVALPGGRIIRASGRANRVGYYYRPQDDFIIDEPGIYTVDVRVTFDGQTSAGQLTPPLPTGHVLGSADGRFFVYVVARGSAPLSLNFPETQLLPRPAAQLDVTASAPAGFTIKNGHMTTMMPGFLLQTGELPSGGASLSFRYDPATLARDFPNLDQDPPADVVTITLFASGTDTKGNPGYAARVLTLHGQQLYNLPMPRSRRRP
ncbi:MAG TPA: hypothetical protein VGL91_03935 [Acidobacteriota bacterium]